jgi:all-trans-retinol 13,14-reductase
VGYENFVDVLAQKFPSERENIRRYAEAVKMVADSSPFHATGKSADISHQFEARYITTSVNDFIASHTSNRTLQNVLVGTIPLYNGVRDKTPLYVHAFINDSNISGAYRIMGGSDQISDLLTRSIRSFGGEIFTLSKVTRIICNNSKATGITLENGTEIAADYIISNIHPEIAVGMIDSSLIRPIYRNRICQMEQTVANFTVYLKFKENTVPYMNHNYYHYNGDSVWDGEKYTEHNWPHGYLYMHLCPSQPSPYAQAAEILTMMRYDEVKQWANAPVGRRGEEYEAFKRRKAEKVLAQLERDFTGIRANVEAYFTSSPLTYLSYTGTKEGSMYGVLRDINAPRIQHRTKIPNVFLTGQNINAHGIMGVIIGAVITCSEFLGHDFLWKQITECR